jgi:hypothetical protein
MAGSPQFKVYNPQGEYVASCKHIEDAACLAGMYGEGCTIRDGHSFIVWREGQEASMAADSYDEVAVVVMDRIRSRKRAAYERIYGKAA